MKSHEPELKDFVRKTLLDIAEGLAEANRARGGDTATFFLEIPVSLSSGRASEGSVIEFDVAISSRSERRVGTGVKLVVLDAGLGGQRTSERVSRIRFKVFLNRRVL